MHQYILFTFRQFKKSRLNLALNLISLISAFLVCSAIMLNAWQQFNTDRFFPNSGRIFRLNCGGYGVTPACFKDLIGNQIPEIEECTRLNSRALEFSVHDQFSKINSICFVDSNFMKVFGIKLILGNLRTALAEPLGLIVTESTARKLYGNTQVLGKAIIHNKKFVFTITAVIKDLPENSHLKINGLTSIQGLQIISENNEKLDDCGGWSQLTYLLLQNPEERQSCEKKVNDLLEDHKMGTGDGKIPLRLEALTSIYFNGENNKFDGSSHGNLLITLAFSVLGLLTILIAFITSVNFSFANSEKRQREIVLRKIYGASKFNIARLFMADTTVVFILAAITSIVITELFKTSLSWQFGFLTGTAQSRVEFYLMFLSISVLLGMLSGTATAIQLSLNSLFTDARKILTGAKARKNGVTMILVHYFLAAIFLSSTIICTQQLNFLLTKNPGFKAENVLQLELDKTLSESTDYLKKSLLKIPGVEKTAYSDAWIGENHGKSSVGEKGKEVLCNFFSVDPDFIDLMGIPMVEGRSYSWLNSSDSVNSIIMNEAAAKALELKNAIGTIFQKKILTGITSDFYYFSLKNSMEPLIIRRLNEKPRVLTIRLTEQNQNRTLDKIMKTCKEISPEFKNRVSTVKDSLNNNYSVERRLSKGIGIYAFIALLLSLIGIAGISIIRVQKKRKEIAIRRILGASVSEVSLLILRGSIHWVVISNLVSIPIILYISNLWLESYANRIDVSPIPFSITLLSTTLVTILVILVITFRACKAVPAEVLREE